MKLEDKTHRGWLQRRKHLNKKLVSKWEINIKDTLKVSCIWKLNIQFLMMGVGYISFCSLEECNNSGKNVLSKLRRAFQSQMDVWSGRLARFLLTLEFFDWIKEEQCDPPLRLHLNKSIWWFKAISLPIASLENVLSSQRPR